MLLSSMAHERIQRGGRVGDRGPDPPENHKAILWSGSPGKSQGYQCWIIIGLPAKRQ